METEEQINRPLVSVAMITYNHRPYIEDAVQSILRQKTDFRVELVIGEDCSTDDTREMVLDLQRRYSNVIRVVTTEKNVGMRKNGARTMAACQGKYVAFCEGDDYWHDPNKLAKQIAYLENRPDYSMVHSHCHRYLVAKKKLLRNSLTVPQGLDDSNAYEDLMLGVRYALTVTAVVRSDQLNWVIEHCPECTDPKWPMGDTQRWLELARLGKVGCIHEPLATTNVLPESAGQSQDVAKRLKFYLSARELKLHYLKKYPVADEVAREVRKRLDLILLKQAFDAGNFQIAGQMFYDYKNLNKQTTYRSKLLYWGSKSLLRKTLVKPLLGMEKNLRRLSRLPARFACGLSSNN